MKTRVTPSHLVIKNGNLYNIENYCYYNSNVPKTKMKYLFVPFPPTFTARVCWPPGEFPSVHLSNVSLDSVTEHSTPPTIMLLLEPKRSPDEKETFVQQSKKSSA